MYEGLTAAIPPRDRPADLKGSTRDRATRELMDAIHRVISVAMPGVPLQ
jgi:hypothetical protein